MMKSRKLAIGLLLILSITVTTGSFAFWQASFTEATDNVVSASVTIGEGEDVTMTLDATSSVAGSALIPTAYGTAGTDDTATWTIPVTYDEDVTSGITSGTLSVALGTPTISGLSTAEINAMFTFAITTNPGTLTVGGAAENVIITVVFATEPSTSTIYDNVALGTLAFDVTLSVVAD